MTSYQSGGIPTWETSIGGGSGADDEVESQMRNQWETRYGMRVDFLAAWAYVLGPISGGPNIPPFSIIDIQFDRVPQYSVLYAHHGDSQRFCPISWCASSALFTVIFSLNSI